MLGAGFQPLAGSPRLIVVAIAESEDSAGSSLVSLWATITYVLPVLAGPRQLQATRIRPGVNSYRSGRFWAIMKAMQLRIPPMPRDGQPIRPELNLRCCSCGYELTGLTVRRCPECGEPFDPRETWLANEESSWKFHFEYVRPQSTYVSYAVLVVLTAAYVLLFLGRASGGGRFALITVIVGEVLIHRYGAGPLPTRLIYLTVGILWMLVCWLAPPF